MKLYEVIEERVLLWPSDFPDEDRVRGLAGYIVDMDAPYESMWCAGQEAKMRPLDGKSAEGKVPNAITSGTAMRILRTSKEIQQGEPFARLPGAYADHEIPPADDNISQKIQSVLDKHSETVKKLNASVFRLEEQFQKIQETIANMQPKTTDPADDRSYTDKKQQSKSLKKKAKPDGQLS